MNERVREVRQALGLSGAKFGERLGLSRMGISQIETGKNNLTESNLLAICREYNVNEQWLRTGEGDMFVITKSSFLDDLQKRFALTDLQTNLIRSYLELSDTDRLVIDNLIRSACQKTDGD